MVFFVNIVTCSNLVELCCIDRHLYLDVLAIHVGSGFGCIFFLHVLAAGFAFMILL